MSDEQITRVGEIDLCHQDFGSPDDPALLLVMGLGFQMIAWPDSFCEQLAGRGFRVVRFDNRDAGRSTHLDHLTPPRRRELFTQRVPNPPYTLRDMADDALGLLSALEMERAHVVGASMGGMIAQTMAATAPARVASLTSVMSTTGHWRVGRPKVRTLRFLAGKPATEKIGYVETGLKAAAVIGSTTLGNSDDVRRDLLERTWDRGITQAGFARQLGAIIHAGDRTEQLRTITAPTLVIHGAADPLIQPSGGLATRDAIPGANLLMLDAMGHDLPEPLWPLIVDSIAGNAARAVSSRDGSGSVLRL